MCNFTNEHELLPWMDINNELWTIIRAGGGIVIREPVSQAERPDFNQVWQQDP